MRPHVVHFGALLMLLMGLGIGVGACVPKGKVGFASLNPSDRLRAAVRASQDDEQSAIPDLIEMLDSDDPAARLVAIETLENLTDQRLGYDWAGPEYERVEATLRWVDWYDLRINRGTSTRDDSSDNSVEIQVD